MKKKILVSLYIVSLFLSCDRQTSNKIDLTNYTTIKIGSSDDEKISLENLISNIEFIILENNKDSFVSNINRIYEYDNQLIIFDDTLNKIVVFSGNGDFIRTIGKIGGGPGEYKDLSDIAFDYNLKQVQALAIDKNSIINYDINGDFTNYYRIDFPVYKFHNLNTEYRAYYVGYFSDDFFNLKIEKNQEDIILNAFKFPEDNEEDLMKYSFTGHLTSFEDSFLYSDATSSRIYEISTFGEIKLKYEFDFDVNPWDENNIYKHDTFFEKIQRGQLSFLRSQYEENDDALVFCYNQSVTTNPKLRTNYQKIGFFNKNKNKAYTHYNLEGDLIYDNLTSPKGKSQNNEYFFSTITNTDVFVDRLKTINDSISIGGKMIHQSLFKDIDLESTIIVKYKMK